MSHQHQPAYTWTEYQQTIGGGEQPIVRGKCADCGQYYEIGERPPGLFDQADEPPWRSVTIEETPTAGTIITHH